MTFDVLYAKQFNNKEDGREIANVLRENIRICNEFYNIHIDFRGRDEIKIIVTGQEESISGELVDFDEIIYRISRGDWLIIFNNELRNFIILSNNEYKVVADTYEEAFRVVGKKTIIKNIIELFIKEIKRSFPTTNIWVVENEEEFDIFHDKKYSDINNKLFFLIAGNLYYNLFIEKGFKNVNFTYSDPRINRSV